MTKTRKKQRQPQPQPSMPVPDNSKISTPKTMNTAPLKTETPASLVNVPAKKRTKALVLGIAVAAAGLVLTVGIVPRLRAHDKLIEASRETSRTTVAVTNVSRATGNPELILPASVRAFEG